MDASLLESIIDVLPRGRTVFYYYKDRYALLLLEYVVRAGCRVADLKQGDFAGLLKKPMVQDVLARCPGGRIERRDLQVAWPRETFGYRLTLSRWPRAEKWRRNWHQTTRRGVNLVLQLNFALPSSRRFRAAVERGDARAPWDSHPIADGAEVTLAWARLDVDLDTGEGLIEEIQSDWVRQQAYRSAARLRDPDSRSWYDYVDRVLLPCARLWDEAMLSATIWFLCSELGLRRIFYHSFESGSRLKHIAWRKPPRSLYSRLPRRFCFRLTHNGPLFIRNTADRRLGNDFRDPTTRWFVLSL